jgi:DNA-nicking Smr family endonuclease
MPRRRTLGPEEAALWQAVAASTRPLRPGQPPRPPETAPPPTPAAPDPAPARPAPVPPFRVGALAAPPPLRHDLAPTIADRLADAPLRMDRKAFVAMVRGRTEPEARLDLHGLTLAAAQPRLVRFVLTAQAEGRRLVLVITGKGRPFDPGAPMPVRIGALRHAVPQWLSMPPLAGAVLQVAPAHRRHGGEGALYVYLRRPR